MLFNSYIFLFAFLPVTYLMFWSLRSPSARYIWLASTGYVFYGYWNPWFCLLMAFSTIVSYCAGLGFLSVKSERGRRLCLVVPVTVDLLLLAYFKYAGFLMATAESASTAIGLPWHVAIPDIVLPVGISFYTFHTISYIVDSYRGVIRPTRNVFEFAAYVSLFSQLVAGPIVRFRQIEEDLESLGHADRTRWLYVGLSFFVFGLVEKVLLADALAALVDPALARYGELSTVGAWAAMLGYSMQIYFDFCGYSDMAVGLGYLFGLRIPQNFNSPYKSADPSEFWRRWHISLSSCLRDYVYIPLGGSRHGVVNTYRNLMLTMLIGGLWHGANSTFVLWGAYHGALLIAFHQMSDYWERVPHLCRQTVTFGLVVFGWVLFRADNLGMAGHLLQIMVIPQRGQLIGAPLMWVVVVGVAMAWAMAGPNSYDLHSGFRWKPIIGVGWAVAFGACLAVIAGTRSAPFLYFQF
jgi:alginate O-acetyltransferase complex protein AlgI